MKRFNLDCTCNMFMQLVSSFIIEISKTLSETAKLPLCITISIFYGFYYAAFGCEGYCHDYDRWAGRHNFVSPKAQLLLHKTTQNHYSK